MSDPQKSPLSPLERRLAEQHRFVDVDRQWDKHGTVRDSLSIIERVLQTSLAEVGICQYEYACHIDDLLRTGKALSLLGTEENASLLHEIHTGLIWAETGFDTPEDAEFYLEVAASRELDLPDDMLSLK